MTFDDYIIKGYELFGPEGMKIATQFFSGEIDLDTCIANMACPVANYYMEKEVRDKRPSKIKVTSQFADYLQKSVVMIVTEPPKHFSGGTIGSWAAVPIEIDDTIENEYYELVYEEEDNDD